MWLCLNNCFLSVVHKNGSDREELTVRARRAEDIQKLFPAVDVHVGVGTDYKFRSIVTRKQLMRAMHNAIESIDYHNFKDSVQDPELHDAYMCVWSNMLRLQGAGNYSPDLFGIPERPIGYWGSHADSLLDDEYGLMRPSGSVCTECGEEYEDFPESPYCPVCGHEPIE